MSQGILNLQMLGRFGNQAMQFLAAKAIAERDNLELRTPRWIGEKIFQIEPTAEPDYSGDYMRGYSQNQERAIYTLRQVREWFRFKPWAEGALYCRSGSRLPLVGHLRRGDLAGYGYPIVAVQSYYDACHKFNLDLDDLCFVSDGIPETIDPIGEFSDCPWLPDFYIMCRAQTLLRANSSFSFVAGMLNTGQVYSPRIDGLTGGEQLVEFEAGNHCRLADLEGFSDLNIKP